MDNKEPLYFTAVLVGFLALLTVCSYLGRSVSAAETKEVRHYAEISLSNLVAQSEMYYVEAFTNLPPEEIVDWNNYTTAVPTVAVESHVIQFNPTSSFVSSEKYGLFAVNSILTDMQLVSYINTMTAAYRNGVISNATLTIRIPAF